MKKVIRFLILLCLFACSPSGPDVNPNTLSPVPISINKDSGKAVITIKKTDSISEIKYPANYFNDSVKIENIAQFSDDEKIMHDDINFILRVTNKGSLPIPDIQSARAISKLRIYLNGDGDMFFMSLANCTVALSENGKIHITTIARNLKDTFDMRLPISKDVSKIYGKTFTYQWEYMGVKSKIIKVDLIKRTFTNVKEHQPKN